MGRWAYCEKDQTEPIGEFALDRHGMGRFNIEGVSVSFPWQVIDDRLIFGSQTSGASGKRLEDISDFLMDWTGSTFLPGRESNRFEIFNRDEIRLYEEANPGALEGTMRRIDKQ